MTIQQIRDLFWSLIGLVEGQYDSKLTSAQADLRIWQGIVELARRARPVDLRATANLSLSQAGGNVYALPTDFHSWLPLEPITINGIPLEKTSKRDLDNRHPGWSTETVQSGTPVLAYVENGKPTTGSGLANRKTIRFYPGITSTMTAVVPYLRYPRKFATLVADTGNFTHATDDYPDLPVDFHEDPCYWAAARFYRGKTEKPAFDPNQFLSDFEGRVQELRRLTREELQEDARPTTPTIGRSLIDAHDSEY